MNELIKQNEFKAQIASEGKVIVERADTIYRKQWKSGKEKLGTGPHRRYRPVLNSEGRGSR
jgi:hypothetical protein